MLRRSLPAVAIATAALASAGGAHAVGAQKIGSPCAAYWNAGAMFVGRVDAIVREPGSRRIAFTMVERFRGPAASSLTVAIDPSSSCGAMFRQGREYLVYADRAGDGRNFVLRCTRTSAVDDAAADLSYARAVKTGTAPPGSIGGQVIVTRRDLAGRILQPPRPLADVPVRISKDGVEDRLTSNRAGDFMIASRGSGTYAVAIEAPPGYAVESGEATLDLADERDCGEVEIRLSVDGRLAGRVTDSRRRPLAGLTVEALTPNLSQRTAALTDRAGRYEFAKMPAGRFVIAVSSGRVIQNGKPARVFLPGVSSAAAAVRVTLAEGSREEAPEFHLPAHVNYVAVEGYVLDADGRPAEGALVYLKGSAEGDRIVGEPVPADFVGRFALAALAGREYAIFAERRRGTRVDSSEAIRVMPAEGLKPITLVLQHRY